MLEVCALGSGSKGNAYVVGGEGSYILIDCGLSARRIRKGLQAANVPESALEGIVLTHEHHDHVAGLPVFRKGSGLPVYATPGTWEGVRRKGSGPFRPVEAGRPFAIGPFRIVPFSVSHDAADPVGLVLESDWGSVGIATDLGCADERIRQRLSGHRVVVIESNHDEDLLRNGSYPWDLKERILGLFGHLSNRDSQSTLVSAAHDRLEAVLLAHLSQENNRVDLALGGAVEALRRNGFDWVRVEVGLQDEAGEVIRLS